MPQIYKDSKVLVKMLYNNKIGILNRSNIFHITCKMHIISIIC